MPTRHPLAADPRIALGDLRELPLRLPPREANPPLVDLVAGACRAAGFEPRPAAAMNDQDMLAAIAAGPPSWTIYYATQAALLAAAPVGVTFRSLDPPLEIATVLAMPVGPGPPASRELLAACRALA